jgi:hypothetical protein
VLVMREYRRQRHYERDRERLEREGWKVVSVLERPGRRGALDQLTGGLASALAPPQTERLVTYAWEGVEPGQARPVRWQPLPRAMRGPLRRRWWILAVVLLLLFLALGLASLLLDLPL